MMNDVSELVTAMLAIAYAAAMLVAGELYMERKSETFLTVPVVQRLPMPQAEQAKLSTHPL
jgi:hypothetical protein